MRIFKFIAVQISIKFLLPLNFLSSQATVADLTVVARVKAGYPDLEVHDVENFIQTQTFVFVPLPLLFCLSPYISVSRPLFLSLCPSLSISISFTLCLCLSLSLTLSPSISFLDYTWQFKDLKGQHFPYRQRIRRKRQQQHDRTGGERYSSRRHG